MTFIVFLFIGSFLLSLLLVFLIKQNFSKQLLDIPNERSSHVSPTPRGGGLGFVITFILGIVILIFFPVLPVKIDPLLPLILLPLAIVGFLDDRYNLPSILRYGVQLGVAIFAIIRYGIFPQPWLTNYGFIGIILAIILTLIAFTALINFYNFMDGLDGIVAGVCVVQLSFITFYLHQYEWLILIAALLGFLYWNWSPAKIFMGDVGSTFLGAVIPIALIQSSDVTIAWSSLAIVLPIAGDTIYTLIIRLRKRENIFQAHRSHIFQRLQQSGWSHQTVALSYILLTLIIGCLIFYYNIYGALLSLILTVILIIISELYLKLNVNYS
ncbi:glycosyltransferase family 4 protein [Geminocystis sp. GBBB08]|uniref:MraY family glycosyltransferase n=1 Tax=Geminocystis sp. GBBB08 TaxID=2604140 RepID=UPI0027E2AB16|nr:glycosyltransferase family 4 protein [Geminocystis sp. GBBB08]MBL1210291.1 glycosyltransferase family 4 protein [Geminocystis sp. GBBB08]